MPSWRGVSNDTGTPDDADIAERGNHPLPEILFHDALTLFLLPAAPWSVRLCGSRFSHGGIVIDPHRLRIAPEFLQVVECRVLV